MLLLRTIIVQLWFQGGMYTQSEILNFDSSEQQEEYQVLAEWDKESSEGDSTGTGANTETLYSQTMTSLYPHHQPTNTHPSRSLKYNC